MTHSPAPWRFGKSLFTGASNIVDDHNNFVCRVRHHRDRNAALIASAPDLLDALKDLLFHLPEVNDDGTLSGAYDAIQSAKAAISKAEPNEINET